MLVLIRAVDWLRPRTVLEVGCGNGLNLAVLACRFPETSFVGVELTAGGVAVAHAIQPFADEALIEAGRALPLGRPFGTPPPPVDEIGHTASLVRALFALR